jgi:hypothetical protein
MGSFCLTFMLKKVKIANNKVTHSEEWGVFLRTTGFLLNDRSTNAVTFVY